MAIARGTRFGSYEVAALIGVGGMGEVYRATDLSLKRDVALKVLPEELLTDANRLARLQREAEVLASLNHANVAHIYGLERSEGRTALVMELVDGITLAERIAQGALPSSEALNVATQIAAALEAAHERGIVHRDLKPANIKLKDDGTIKVLDFGIAKALDLRATSGPPPQDLTAPAMTETGVVLGTAGYMSPEQARGKAVDKRADIWAFGCVLYEMLTGNAAFHGDDMTTTLARVLERDPDMRPLPAGLSPAVRRTLELCLQKDVKERLRDIGDVRLALKGAFVERVATPTRAPWRRVLPIAGAVVAGAVLAGAYMASLVQPALPPAMPVTRFSVDLAGPLRAFQPVALSPDGRRIVYATTQLYSHRLDQDAARAIPGTEGASDPFFSPDGESVAFFTETQLKTVGFGGELPRVLANIDSTQGLVGAWDDEGRILFGKAGPFGLLLVPDVGGKPIPFADPADYRDLDYPDVLPGGQWVLFSATVAEQEWRDAVIVAQNIASGERKVVLEGGHFARYVPTGHLLFVRDATLYAVAFDVERSETQGTPVPVVQGIATTESSGHAAYAVAANGTLIYVPGPVAGQGLSSIVHVDVKGKVSALSAERRPYARPRVSPDGLRLAVEVTDTDSRAHIWIMDLATRSATQLTFEGTANQFAVWTLDGREVLFRSNRDGAPAVYRQVADGTAEAVRVLEGSDQLVPTDMLPGNVLLYQDRGPGGYRDILTFDIGSGGPPSTFLATPDDERSARTSPDGAWVSYVSNESTGPRRVYARPYPSRGGGQRAVSGDVGTAPIWSPRGEEIYFLGPFPQRLLAVSVSTTASTLTRGGPQPIVGFVAGQLDTSGHANIAPYDVMPNGDGFVAVLPAGSTVSADSQIVADRTTINVVLNWFEELKRLVPTE